MTPAAQHASLLAIAAVIGSRQSKLQQDETGRWSIGGKRGRVEAEPEGYLLYAPQKQKFSFGEVRDGPIKLPRLPTAAEAGEIRVALGISHKHFRG